MNLKHSIRKNMKINFKNNRMNLISKDNLSFKNIKKNYNN